MKHTDKQRLDWLIEKEVRVCNHRGDYWVLGTEDTMSKTGREAIDAAMDAETKEG